MTLDLLATRRIIWTTPIDARVRGAVTEIQEIDQRATLQARTPRKTATTKEDAEGGVAEGQAEQQATDKKRRQELIKRVTPAKDYRFTLRTVTSQQAAKHPLYIRSFGDQFLKKHGKSTGDHYDREKTDRSAPDWMDRHNEISRGFGWAAIMTSLVRLEERTHDLLTGEASDWKEITIPDEWQSYESFSDNVPQTLEIDLEEAAHIVNPGLWRTEESEEAKNVGGISVE